MTGGTPEHRFGLPGTRVVDADGAVLGTVADVVSAPGAPAELWVRVLLNPANPPAVLPVPAEVVGGTGTGRRELRVPFRSEQVRAAPAVAGSGGLSAADRERLRAHYGLAGTDAHRGAAGIGGSALAVGRRARSGGGSPGPVGPG